MKTTDWRELCRELVDAQDAHDATGRGMTEVLTRARAALSEPVGEPAPPAAGEVGELVAWLREAYDSLCKQNMHLPLLVCAADLLERQAAPVLEPALARINDILNDSGRVCLADEREALELARQALEQRQVALAPVAVSERLPAHIEQALIKAECALSDIAEGEPEENEGDSDALLSWAEQRAAVVLARIRPVMREHGLRTSEWPPLPATALPLPQGEVE